MNSYKKLAVRLFVSLLLPFVATNANAQLDVPPNFTLDGELVDPGTGLPNTSASVNFRFSIYTFDKGCLLYQEDHTGIDLSDPDLPGVFSITVGGGSPTGGDPGFTITQIFSNAGVESTSCGPGSSPAGSDRILEVMVDDGSSGIQTLSPDFRINSVPMAIVAQSVQGWTPNDFVKQAESGTGDLGGSWIGGLQVDRIQGYTFDLGAAPTAGDVMKWNGSEFAPAPDDDSGAPAPDSLTAAEIAPNAITASELANDSVDTGAIQNDSVTTAKILDGTILDADISGMSGGKLTANSVTASQLAPNTITFAEIATDTITVSEMAPNSVGASELANGAVDLASIDGAICTNGEILKNSGGTSWVCAPDDTGALGVDSVTATELADNAVDLAAISDSICSNGAVLKKSGGTWICGTDDDSAPGVNSIGSSELADNAVDLAAISDSICSNGDVLKKSGGVWICGADNTGTPGVDSITATELADNAVDLASIDDTMCSPGEVMMKVGASWGCQVPAAGPSSIGKTELADNTVDLNKIDDAICANGQVLKKSGGLWTCGPDLTGGSSLFTDHGSYVDLDQITDAMVVGGTGWDGVSKLDVNGGGGPVNGVRATYGAASGLTTAAIVAEGTSTSSRAFIARLTGASSSGTAITAKVETGASGSYTAIKADVPVGTGTVLTTHIAGGSATSMLRGDGRMAIGKGTIDPNAHLDVDGKIHAHEICAEDGTACVDISSGFGGGGTITGASNLGGGAQVFDTGSSGAILDFKSLVAGTGIDITPGGADITVEITPGPLLDIQNAAWGSDEFIKYDGANMIRIPAASMNSEINAVSRAGDTGMSGSYQINSGNLTLTNGDLVMLDGTAFLTTLGTPDAMRLESNLSTVEMRMRSNLSSGANKIELDDNDKFYFSQGGTSTVTIDVLNNRLGVNNLNPLDALDVNGDAYVSGDVTAGVDLNAVDVNATNNVTATNSLIAADVNVGDVYTDTVDTEFINFTNPTTGHLNMNSRPILDVAPPINPDDAATKDYVDTENEVISVFYKRNTGPFTFTMGTPRRIDYDIKEHDVGGPGLKVTIGGTWQFQVPAGGAGIYQITASIVLDNSTNGELRLHYGPTGTNELLLHNTELNQSFHRFGSGTVMLNDNDIVYVTYTREEAGGTGLFYTDPLDANYISITRIGPAGPSY